LIEVKLGTPIEAHDETIDTLSIRRPKGGDVMDLGMPFTAQADGTAIARMDLMGKYISALAGIPISSIRKMEVADLMQAVQVISGFFGETVSSPQMEAAAPSKKEKKAA